MVHPHPSVVTLVGNPRPGSRTRTAAEHLAGRLVPVLADDASGVSTVTIDLADLGHQLFTADRPLVEQALRQVAAADVLLVATPVYKASYTGLLKAFLDSYGPDGLAGVTAVGVVVSGNPAHALVGEVHLHPLLVELGATVPTRAFTVTEADLADLDPAVDRWLERAAEPLRRALGGVASLAEVLR